MVDHDCQQADEDQNPQRHQTADPLRKVPGHSHRLHVVPLTHVHSRPINGLAPRRDTRKPGSQTSHAYWSACEAFQFGVTPSTTSPLSEVSVCLLPPVVVPLLVLLPDDGDRVAVQASRHTLHGHHPQDAAERGACNASGRVAVGDGRAARTEERYGLPACWSGTRGEATEVPGPAWIRTADHVEGAGQRSQAVVTLCLSPGLVELWTLRPRTKSVKEASSRLTTGANR